MRVSDRLRERDRKLHRTAGLELAVLPYQRGKAVPLHVFENQVENAIVLAGVVQRHDVRMRQRADNPRFLQQRGDALAAQPGFESRQDRLQRDLAPKTSIGRQIDGALGTLAEN